MSSTFSIALSGLKAQSQAINTTGNNLANMNTDGFKQSAVNFKDLFSEFLGVSSGFQTGLGVSPPISTQLFTQGPIQSSLSPLAAAIQGDARRQLPVGRHGCPADPDWRDRAGLDGEPKRSDQ